MPHPYTVDRQAKLVKRHVVSQVGVASSVASDVAIELISSGMLLGYQAIPHSSSHILKCSSLSLFSVFSFPSAVSSATLFYTFAICPKTPPPSSPPPSNPPSSTCVTAISSISLTHRYAFGGITGTPFLAAFIKPGIRPSPS